MKSDKKQFLQIGLTIFASLSAVVAFFFIVLRYQGLKAYLDIVSLALQPVMAGVVIAYVLCPVAKFLERQFRRVKGLSRAARPRYVVFTHNFSMGIRGKLIGFVKPQWV